MKYAITFLNNHGIRLCNQKLVICFSKQSKSAPDAAGGHFDLKYKPNPFSAGFVLDPLGTIGSLQRFLRLSGCMKVRNGKWEERMEVKRRGEWK